MLTKKVFTAAMAIVISLSFATKSYAEKNGDERSSSGITYLHRNYPNGSYYSENGHACVDCHGSKDNNYKHIGDINLCNCGKYIYTDPETKVQRSCYQCMAFARYCYYIYNDKEVPGSADSGLYIPLTENNLYNKLSAIGNQSYIRGVTNSGTVHSVFVVSFTRNEVTILESNFDNKCGVTNSTLSYAQFLSHIKTINGYYTKGGKVGTANNG